MVDSSDDEDETLKKVDEIEEEKSDVEECPQDTIPGSLEAWLCNPINAEAMLKKIEDMRSHAAVHGLGPEHESFKVQSRAITAKDLEAETQMIVCKKPDAHDADGSLTTHVVSIQELAKANPEM